MIRVLVVEDSPTWTKKLILLLESDGEIEVVGQAASGLQAVEMAADLRPDLITMDVVMPDMDGLEATRRIMAANPTPILIVTAHENAPGLKLVFNAMKAGALEVMNKSAADDDDAWKRELIIKVKALAKVRPHQVGE
ncbi:MAG: response regulator [Syntrophales bacterium]|nr:response regulator [Syntrophales bacterium]